MVYSRILPDYQTFKLFYRANMIFVNGNRPLHQGLNCIVNDFIQIVVSKWYYVFSRWLLNWNFIRSSKVKRLIFRKNLSSRFISIKSKKQRSRVVPDWIFLSKNDFSDVKCFLEVDYFTLSFFVLYEPYTTYYYSPTQLLLPKNYVYKLYNWKYIT